MAVTYQSAYTGRVEQREYAQTFDFEYAGGVRSLVTAKVVEQTFRFLGLTRTLAFGTSSISVTDINGPTYTFTPVSSITDGSSGSRVMVNEEVDVQRVPMSPHMWELIVTRRGLQYYVNGSLIISGPSWAFPS